MTHDHTILQLGHPTLRQRAAPIADVKSPHIQHLIDDLLAIVQQANGVGIAAPQIGYSCQLVIVASRPNARYPHAPLMEPTALINPRIIAHADDQLKDWEGCLSVAGTRGLVPRFSMVEVEYLDQLGSSQRRVFTDFVARIVQHECDHLEGRMFVDRVENTQEFITEAEYQQQLQTISMAEINGRTGEISNGTGDQTNG